MVPKPGFEPGRILSTTPSMYIRGDTRIRRDNERNIIFE
jgi:hypothetical protein